MYQKLSAATLSPEALERAARYLRILSGLYGVLKPTDAIAPYRLEMGTRWEAGGAANLHEFWRKSITEQLQKELSANDFVVNLASDEYAKAVDFKALEAPVYKIDFKEWRNGKLKSISFNAKRARGEMTRWLLEHNITEANQLKDFSEDGYKLEEQADAHKLLFVK